VIDRGTIYVIDCGTIMCNRSWYDLYDRSWYDLYDRSWQLAGSDLSVLGMRNMEGDAYPHYNPDYSNLACGVNGYIYSFSAIKWALKGKYDGVCPQISGFLLVVIMYLRKLLVLDFE
jgi:hypothetical protein